MVVSVFLLWHGFQPSVEKVEIVDVQVERYYYSDRVNGHGLIDAYRINITATLRNAFNYRVKVTVKFNTEWEQWFGGSSSDFEIKTIELSANSTVKLSADLFAGYSGFSFQYNVKIIEVLKI